MHTTFTCPPQTPQPDILLSLVMASFPSDLSFSKDGFIPHRHPAFYVGLAPKHEKFLYFLPFQLHLHLTDLGFAITWKIEAVPFRPTVCSI